MLLYLQYFSVAHAKVESYAYIMAPVSQAIYFWGRVATGTPMPCATPRLGILCPVEAMRSPPLPFSASGLRLSARSRAMLRSGC